MRQVRRHVSSALVLAAAAALLSACGATNSPSSTPSASPTTSSASTTPPPTASSLRVAPGRVGSAVVGMTEQQALTTGYFDRADSTPSESCPRLSWRQPLSAVLDVSTTTSGAIASLSVRAAGPTTDRGLGVGSTLAQVSAVYETARLTESGHGQTGVFVSDGRAWLGFLFDKSPSAVSRGDKVVLMQVTSGAQPTLLLSNGC